MDGIKVPAKAITICQPWAWLIIHGPKRVENRTWYSKFRGPLAIHAGNSRGWLDACRDPELRRLVPDMPQGGGDPRLVFGAIIGTVEQVDCVTSERWIAKNGPDWFACGPWCHVYTKPTAIEPIRCGGALGYWDTAEAISKAVRTPLQVQEKRRKPGKSIAGSLFDTNEQQRW